MLRRWRDLLLLNIYHQELPLLPTALAEREIEPPNEAVRERREFDSVAECVLKELCLVLLKRFAGPLHLDEDGVLLLHAEAVIYPRPGPDIEFGNDLTPV